LLPFVIAVALPFATMSTDDGEDNDIPSSEEEEDCVMGETVYRPRNKNGDDDLFLGDGDEAEDDGGDDSGSSASGAEVQKQRQLAEKKRLDMEKKLQAAQKKLKLHLPRPKNPKQRMIYKQPVVARGQRLVVVDKAPRTKLQRNMRRRNVRRRLPRKRPKLGGRRSRMAVASVL
jgi:hypothetical protein